MDTSKHPFRISVFGVAEVVKGKGKRARVERQGYGFDLEVACDMVLDGPAPVKLNKDKIIADLQAGIEIPGAFILTDRTRLDVK
jgi:hypothetical protein